MAVAYAEPVSPAVSRPAVRSAGVVATRAETLVNTHAGTAAPRRALLGGEAIATYVFGHAGIPGDGASAARLHVQLDSATGSGVVSVHHGDFRDPHPLVVRYAKGRTSDGVATVSLGQSGRLVVENVSAARIQVHIWVTGYTPMGNIGADTWSESGGDAGGSGANPHAAVSLASLARLHRLADLAPAMTFQPLLLSGGVAYTTEADPKDNFATILRAVDLATGRTRWTAAGYATIGGLALYGDALYVVDQDRNFNTRVSAVSLSTHTVIWRTLFPASGVGNPSAGGPVAVDAGVVLLGGTGRLDALDAGTGQLLLSDHTSAALAVAEDGRTLAVAGDGVAVLDLRTHRVLWTMIHADARFIMAGHRIIASTYDRVYAFDISGCGRAVCYPIWQARTDAPVDNVGNQYMGIAASDAVVAVAISTDVDPGPTMSQYEVTQFRTFSARTGASLITRRAGAPGYSGPLFGSPVIAGQLILEPLGADLDVVSMLCRGACALHHVLADPDYLTSQTSIAGGYLTVTDPQSTASAVYAIG